MAPAPAWFLNEMVAQNTVRTYGVNQVVRFIEGIWLPRKNLKIGFFSQKNLLYFIRAQFILSYHLI